MSDKFLREITIATMKVKCSRSEVSCKKGILKNFVACNDVLKYGVFCGPYFPVFSPNMGKYGPEKTLYLDTFQAAINDQSSHQKESSKLIYLQISHFSDQLICFYLMAFESTLKCTDCPAQDTLNQSGTNP